MVKGVQLLHLHQQKLIHLKLSLAIKVNNQQMVNQAKAAEIHTLGVAQIHTQIAEDF